MDTFITTRGSKKLGDVQNNHELINCSTSRKKQTDPSNQVCSNSEKLEKASSKSKEEIEAELKRFRYEIMKFGMSGLQKLDAVKAKTALALSLGAKPQKNKRKNYKKVIEESKRAKAKEIKEKKLAAIANKQSKKNRVENKLKTMKKKKDSNGILGDYGKATNNQSQNKKEKRHKGISAKRKSK